MALRVLRLIAVSSIVALCLITRAPTVALANVSGPPAGTASQEPDAGPETDPGEPLEPAPSDAPPSEPPVSDPAASPPPSDPPPSPPPASEPPPEPTPLPSDPPVPAPSDPPAPTDAPEPSDAPPDDPPPTETPTQEPEPTPLESPSPSSEPTPGPEGTPADGAVIEPEDPAGEETPASSPGATQSSPELPPAPTGSHLRPATDGANAMRHQPAPVAPAGSGVAVAWAPAVSAAPAPLPVAPAAPIPQAVELDEAAAPTNRLRADHPPVTRLIDDLEPVSAGLAAGLAASNRATGAVSVAIEFGRAGGGWAGAIVFNLWLRRQLRERRMSQRQLASLSGVDHSTISRLLQQDRRPSLATATKLARALRHVSNDFDAAEYFGRMPEESPIPGRRVEMALRSDELLEDDDVKQLMHLYLETRRRRKAPEAAPSRSARARPARIGVAPRAGSSEESAAPAMPAARAERRS